MTDRKDYETKMKKGVISKTDYAKGEKKRLAKMQILALDTVTDLTPFKKKIEMLNKITWEQVRQERLKEEKALEDFLKSKGYDLDSVLEQLEMKPCIWCWFKRWVRR